MQSKAELGYLGEFAGHIHVDRGMLTLQMANTAGQCRLPMDP